MLVAISMTIKKGLIVLAILLIFNALSLAAQERPIRQGSLEVIVGSYDMKEPRFDAVYPSGGVMAGLGVSVALISNLNVYLEAKYWMREGQLTFTKEKTDFRLVPVSLGARYILPLGIANPYLGAGGDIYFYHEDNPIGTTLNHTGGYHVMGGTYLRFSKSFPLMLDLKLKYTWAKASESDLKIQLGGLEYAVGLALAF
jgi:hypothetical protein